MIEGSQFVRSTHHPIEARQVFTFDRLASSAEDGSRAPSHQVGAASLFELPKILGRKEGARAKALLQLAMSRHQFPQKILTYIRNTSMDLNRTLWICIQLFVGSIQALLHSSRSLETG